MARSRHKIKQKLNANALVGTCITLTLEPVGGKNPPPQGQETSKLPQFILPRFHYVQIYIFPQKKRWVKDF